ncbi:MAG: hypothetical protein ACREUX_05205, partial [Burkholderiales bacterium]
MTPQPFYASPVDPVRADLPLQPVRTPQAWHGPDLARCPEEWIHILSPAEVAELRAGIAAVEARGMDVVAIRAEDFPLPTLGGVLRGIRHELLYGRGFAV